MAVVVFVVLLVVVVVVLAYYFKRMNPLHAYQQPLLRSQPHVEIVHGILPFEGIQDLPLC
jgi:hypothetical protein